MLLRMFSFRDVFCGCFGTFTQTIHSNGTSRPAQTSSFNLPTSSRTEKLLLRLSIVIINTGLWTALVALFIILTASHSFLACSMQLSPPPQLVIWPQIQIYVSLYFILCPLYCNTLLANFNSREYVRGADFDTEKGNSGIMSRLSWRTPPTLSKSIEGTPVSGCMNRTLVILIKSTYLVFPHSFYYAA